MAPKLSGLAPTEEEVNQAREILGGSSRKNKMSSMNYRLTQTDEGKAIADRDDVLNARGDARDKYLEKTSDSSTPHQQGQVRNQGFEKDCGSEDQARRSPRDVAQTGD